MIILWRESVDEEKRKLESGVLQSRALKIKPTLRCRGEEKRMGSAHTSERHETSRALRAPS